MNTYNLGNLIDIDELQNITESLHNFTGVTFGLQNHEDRILVSAGWQDICLNFHRQNTIALKNCHISDRYVRNNVKQMTFVEYMCKNGLVEIAMPIYIKDQYVGTTFVGQFFYDGEEKDEAYFRNQATSFGLDTEAYIEAYKKVPKFTRERIKNILKYFSELVLAMVNNGYLAMENEKARTTAEEALQRYNALFSAMDDLVFINDMDFKYMDFMSSETDSLYVPRDVFIGKRIDKVLPQNVSDLLMEEMRAVAGGRQVGLVEYELDLHGEHRWYSGKITLIKGSTEKGNRFLTVVRDITKLKKNEILIKKLAYSDGLTGLYNRERFFQAMDQTIESHRQEKRSFGVAFIDIDNFKHINDSKGHIVGDWVLKETASCLKEGVRSGDVVARMGGDEFTVIMMNFEETDEIKALLNRILKMVSTKVIVMDHHIDLTCSIGVAVYPEDGHDSGELVRCADVAMYQAKESGKNKYRFYSESIAQTYLNQVN